MILILVICITGCAAMRATVSDIKGNPKAFRAEAEEIGNAIKPGLPAAIPVGVGTGIGYALAFFRRLYVNMKKKESKEMVDLLKKVG